MILIPSACEQLQHHAVRDPGRSRIIARTVTWKISENNTRPEYRPLVAGRKRYVRMGHVEVSISTDSVSLIIILFSDVVDGVDLYIARIWEAMASTWRGQKKNYSWQHFILARGRSRKARNKVAFTLFPPPLTPFPQPDTFSLSSCLWRSWVFLWGGWLSTQSMVGVLS